MRMSDRRTSSYSAAKELRESIVTTTLNQEEEINGATQNLDAFEEMCELVQKFEETCYQVKKAINKMEKDTQTNTILGQTLKTCYQRLQKFLQNESPKFNDEERVEGKIHEANREATRTTKEFSKFKGDYFLVSEQVVNKDIGQLKMQAVKTQTGKLEKIAEKLKSVQSQSEMTVSFMSEVKEKYEQFEQGYFDDKNGAIRQIGQTIDRTDQSNLDIEQQIVDAFTDVRTKQKEVCPSTKEQRAKVADFNVKLARIDRRFQKTKVNNDKLTLQRSNLSKDEEKCEDITASITSQPIKGMIAQTTKLEVLIETCKDVTKHQIKQSAIEKELIQILNDIRELELLLDELIKTMQSGLQDEFEKLANRIIEISEKIGIDTEEQSQRLESFEHRISDITISD